MSGTKEQTNKALVRRAVEEIWNKGNIQVADQLTHPTYVGHMPGGQDVTGIDGVKKAIEGFRSAFPDVHLHIESQVAEGDEVITQLVMKGTQKGPLKTDGKSQNLPATGKHVSGRGVSRMRIEDGKVVEEWVTWDEQSAMETLGTPGLRPSYK